MKTGTRERGIPVSAPMVKAILTRQKTQMRTPIARQDARHWAEPHEVEPREVEPGRWAFLNLQCGESDYAQCPYRVGDRLYVKETFGRFSILRPFDRANIVYRADEPANDAQRWRSSRFMPKWAARIWLEVTGVRAERLQDISEEDACSEGLVRRLTDHYWEGYTRDADGHRQHWTHGAGHDPDNPAPADPSMLEAERIVVWVSARDGFRDTWDSLHKRDWPWAKNPWVFAISFRRMNAQCGRMK